MRTPVDSVDPVDDGSRTVTRRSSTGAASRSASPRSGGCLPDCFEATVCLWRARPTIHTLLDRRIEGRAVARSRD